MIYTYRNLKWTPDLSVGVKLLDDQHKKIFNAINEITDFNLTLDGPKLFSDSVESITQLMSQHLRDVEDYLRSSGYPYFEEHQHSHTNLLDGYSDLLYRLTKHEEGVETEIVSYLHKWWVKHIYVDDMSYRDYFQSRFPRQAKG